MDLKGRDREISHALQPPAPAALTAKVPAPAASAAQGARLAVASDPTHLLTELSLADIRHLVASAESAAHVAPVQPAAAQAATAPRPAAAGRSPWAWLWATLESVATIYVALTEPQRRSGGGQA